jgi:predicted lipoprotein with Yx(FWY)xxD motif
MRIRQVTGAAAIVFALAGCASASQTTPGSAYGTTAGATAVAATGSSAAVPTQAGTILTIRKTKIGYVLTNVKGLTLYWYGKDVKGKRSACTGGCLTAWPAVTGKPVAASGVRFNGKLGTISRGGGLLQATYNGYPLYTYSSDTAPGQTTGNGSGGVWHVITGKVLTSLAG